MAEFSKIAWTDATFNPWVGCSRVSPGCQNCYAENLMARRYGRVKWGPGQPRSRTKTWGDPVRWNRQAEASGVRKKVFCASLADWLDDEVTDQWRQDLCQLIERCTSLDWLLLTKRPNNAGVMLPQTWFDIWPSHVWFGVTAENQQYYDLRVAQLRRIPAAVQWVSYEPALGPIHIRDRPGFSGWYPDWLIIGGESAHAEPARRFDIEWAESAIAQCREFRVVPFMKQVGSNVFRFGQQCLVKDKAGADPDEWPESIRVREFPAISVYNGGRFSGLSGPRSVL